MIETTAGGSLPELFQREGESGFRARERGAAGGGTPTTANRALSLSGDDFAEYLLQTKGAYAYLGTANLKKPHTCISNHRGDFDIDEETLPLGAALYAAYALSVLDPQFAK